jgi:hypothetical protein
MLRGKCVWLLCAAARQPLAGPFAQGAQQPPSFPLGGERAAGSKAVMEAVGSVNKRCHWSLARLLSLLQLVLDFVR